MAEITHLNGNSRSKETQILETQVQRIIQLTYFRVPRRNDLNYFPSHKFYLKFTSLDFDKQFYES